MAKCHSCNADLTPGARWCNLCRAHTMSPKIGRLASPAKRLGAFLLDGILPLVALAVIFGVAGTAEATDSGLGRTVGNILAFGLFIGYVVWALMLFATEGMTPGKYLLGLRVIKEDGSVAGFLTMLIREWVGKWISSFVLSLGFLWILLDKENQGWHDKLMNTYVVSLDSRRGASEHVPGQPERDDAAGQRGVGDETDDRSRHPANARLDAAGVRRLSGSLGRGVLIAATVGLLAVVAVGISLLLSRPGAPAGESRRNATGNSLGQAQADGGGAVSPSSDVEGMAVAIGVEDARGDNSAPTQATEAELRLDRSARRRIQAGLTAAGFSPGSPDGLFGAGTRRAIREWQATRSSSATGYLDADEASSLMALGASSGAAPEPRNARSPAPPPPRNTGSPAGEARLVVQAAPESLIEIDGAQVGATNQAGVLVVTGMQAGRHIVVASKEGYETVNRGVEVIPGRSDVVELTMVPRPATLSVTASVPDAIVRIAGVGEYRLPVTGRRIEPGSYRLTVSKPLFVEVEEDVEVRAGQSATLDFVLRPRPVDELLSEVRTLFNTRRYSDVVRGARTVLELHPQAGEPYLLAGRALYELGNFDDSAAFLRQAIDLGQEVELPTKHRHAGLGLLENFCDGVLSLTKDEVVFRSFSSQDHGFRAAPQRMLELRPQAARNRRVTRIDSRIAVLEGGRERTRNFDFLHKDTIRETNREGISLSCRGCDASMNVQAALLQYLRRSAM